MTTAFEVLRYIKSQITPWGETQVQKLAYYSQAWSTVWEGRPLFGDRIEAWGNGPVVPNLRFSLRRAQPDPTVLTTSDREVVDAVINYYGGMTGGQLSSLTHDERPWLDARGDLPDGVPSSVEIPLDSLRKFYTVQSMQGVGPHKTPVVGEASDDDVLYLAGLNADRWRGTLDLLSR